MSKAFGPVFQVAYVTRDLDADIAHWTQVMGVGPFFTFPTPLDFEWLELKGERVAPDSDVFGGVAVAYSGDTMIELIQPGSVASPYTDFLGAGRNGVHHLGTFTDQYDYHMAAARKSGIGVAMEGKLPLSRFAYLETDAQFPGTMVEIIEPTAMMLDTFEMIKAEADNWTGKDPVRSL